MRILSIESSGRTSSVATAVYKESLSDNSDEILPALIEGAGNSTCSLQYLSTGQTGQTKSDPKIRSIGSSASLTPTVQDALKAAGWTAQDIDLIAVSVGPGSFTGLRVGIVTAKTMAYAINCPIACVHAADALAYQALQDLSANEGLKQPRELEIGLDIGRGEILTFQYTLTENQFAGERAGRILTAGQWSEVLKPGVVAIGSGLKHIDDAVQQSLHLPAQQSPCAETIAALAVANAASTTDYWSIEPLYSRPSAAEEAKVKRDK